MAGIALTLSIKAWRFGYFAKASSPVKDTKEGLKLVKYKSAQVN
jgi:hypothetical protein